MKVIEMNGHTITWKLNAPNPPYNKRGTLTCSCGKQQDGVWATKGGQPHKSKVRLFADHAKPLEPSKINEPLLVGVVEKPRVTHEVWVFHITHDFPRNISKLSAYYHNKDFEKAPWLLWQPYSVLCRNSATWHVMGRAETLTGAMALAHQQVKLNMGTILVDAPKSGIPAAPSTVQTVVAELINAYKAANTIGQLQKAIADVDDQLNTIFSLQEFRNELSERLRKATGLDLE